MALTDKQFTVLQTVAGATHQSEVIDYLPEMTPAQVKGTLVSLATKELILLNKIEDGDKTIDITKKGHEILNPTPEPEVTHWVDVHPVRKKGCTACDEVAANDIGEVDTIWYDRPIEKAKKAGKSNPSIEVSEELQDPEFYGKLSRKQCLAILAESGYNGPVSYLMPKLRAITEQYGTLTTDMEAEITGETVAD